MASKTNQGRGLRLLNNGRFWILSLGLITSLIILGLVQQLVPPGILQMIRLEQAYGFVAVGLLFLALLAMPLTVIVPDLAFKDAYLHSRRAIGVLVFYYALLHSLIAFFKQLGGFSGLKYLNATYSVSIAAGAVALLILLLLTVTSLDWAVRKLTFKYWKRLHRWVYLAGVLILLHVFLIGTHYINHTIYYYLTITGTALLVLLEAVRIYRRLTKRDPPEREIS